MMMYKIKRRKRFRRFMGTALYMALLSAMLFAVGYVLQVGLHEYLIETLMAGIVLAFFIIIFLPRRKL